VDQDRAAGRGPGALALRDRALSESAIQLRESIYGNLPYTRIMKQGAPSTARLEARLPHDIHALLKRAAQIQGRTLTDFVVSAARDAASRTIEEAEILRLSIEDQRRLAKAILNPPAPVRALKNAFQRRRALFGGE
jgi:uncharacterized protein (DUF1778 family)